MIMILQTGPSNPATGFGEAVNYLSEVGEERHFAVTRHVPCALTTPSPDLKRISGVFRAHGTCLAAANVPFLLHEI